MVARVLILIALLLASACATTSDVATSTRTLAGVETTPREIFASARETLVVFATVWCDACEREWPRVRAYVEERPSTQLLYVVSGSPARDVEQMAARWGIDARASVLVDERGAIADDFKVERTPTLFVVGKDGKRAGPYDDLGAIEDSARVTIEDRGVELGTSYQVALAVPARDRAMAERDLAEVRAKVVARFEQLMSEWRPDSEISRVNARGRDAPVAVSPEVYEVIEGALHVARATSGAYDPTWAALSDTWRRAERDDRWPDRVDTAAVGAHLVELTRQGRERRVRLHRSTKIGVAGLAKGYIIDRVFHALRARGYHDIVVNIGGDVRAAGRDARGETPRFFVQDPFGAGVACELLVDDRALATSGNYLRTKTIEGSNVGHILDPRTGYPPFFDGSVTVLTRDAAMADALATALFVMGPSDGLAFVRATEGLDAVYVTRAGVVSTLP